MGIKANFIIPKGIDISKGQDNSDVVNMVLNKDYTVNDGYIKVDSLSGNKELLDVVVFFKRNRETEDITLAKTYEFIPSVEDVSPNFIKQAYEFLKSLPEFEGSEDVIEDTASQSVSTPN